MYKNPKIKFTVLGSGTSSGVPTIACNCPTCVSTDSRDKRLRASLLIESANTTILIDTTPDFRQQMLSHKVMKLDAILFTHSHFDHIGGFDDIRAYNYTMNKPIDIFLTQNTLNNLRKTFHYAFEEPEQIGGGVPLFNINYIDSKPITIGDIEIIPFHLLHGILDVIGYRIGNLAYCTDTNCIPTDSYKYLKNLDVLIIDALRYKKHTTHFSLDEAIKESQRINANTTYFTHLAHQIKHKECETELYNINNNINLAYDGLVIEL